MTNTGTIPNLQVPAPCLDEPPPPPVPPPPPPPKQKPLNCVQCSVLLKNSPARRSGPQGPGTLCNACGLRILKRKRAARGAIKKSPRRPRQNRTSRKRQSQSRNNNSTQPPLYPNIRQTASASTDVPITQPSTPQNSVQPRLFPAINHAQSHVTLSPASSVSPVTSSSTSVEPSPTIPCAQPASPINPANVDIIQPNTVPAATINPAHTSGPCSGPLHPSSPTPVHRQNVAPPVRQSQSSADPIQLQLSAGAPSKNGHIMHTQPHQHGMPSLPGQYADADSAGAEQMFNALRIAELNETGETATEGSDNKIDQASFPANVFGRCDSAATTSTQLDLVEVLEEMENSPEQMPPGNGMFPVEGPYADDGTVDHIAMAMGSMPMTSTPVSMAPAHYSGMLPVQSSPAPNLVVQPSAITTCMDSLTTLGQMNSQITHSVSSMDDRIVALARKHEELTQARNEVVISITQLEREKNVAAKKQRQVCDDIARTTCLLHFLQKQQPFPTGA